MSLTNEEYSEYLSLCNEIAEVYPSLVTSYDSQGNAILNLGTNAQTATEQLQDMLEVDRQIANLEIASNLQDAFKGARAEYNQLQEEIDKLGQSAEDNQHIVDSLLPSGTDSIYKQLDELASGVRDYLDINTGAVEITKKLRNVLDKYGLYGDNTMIWI